MFTPGSAGSGSYTITYTVEDSNGDTGTTTVATTMSSESGGVSSGGDSGLSVSGGLGGGYTLDPTSGYTPSEVGNFTYTVSQGGAWSRGTGSSGTQSLTRVVTTTYADADNWSYVEFVTYLYDVNQNDGAGNSSHSWGSMIYTFSATSVLGVVTTTMNYNSTDNYDVYSSESSASGTFNDHKWGSYSTTVFVQNVDGFLDSGTQIVTTTQTANSLGSGTYTYPVYGGSVSGTVNTSGNDYNFFTKTLNYVEAVGGGWLTTGTTSFNGNGSQSYSYSGSGSYGDSDFTGTINESGAQNRGYSYTGNGMHWTGIGWALTGTGHASGDQNQNYSYSGTGTYSRNESGSSVTGTYNADGHNNSSGDFRIDYSLVNNLWEVVSGSGSGGGDSHTYSDYSGSGTYSRTANGGTVSGTINEDGHEFATDNYTTTSTLVAGDWVYAGSGSGSGDSAQLLRLQRQRHVFPNGQWRHPQRYGQRGRPFVSGKQL